MPTDTNLNVRLISAHHTEAEWNSITTIPKDGELLFTDTGLHDGWYKRGDGIHQWKDLLYIKPSYDYSEIQPLKSKTFNNVTCTANSDPAGFLYFATVKPDNFQKPWRVTYRVKAVINGIQNGYQYCEVTIDGVRNTYVAYKIYNAIANTSYRPLYYHMLHSGNETGFNNDYPHLLGIGFRYSYNPATAANSRKITIDIFEEENCILTFLDNMTLFASMPGSSTTNYGNTTSGVNATRYLFDGTTQGYTVTGDRNDTVTLNNSYTQFVAGTNGIKAYSLVMQDENGTWQSFTTDAGYNVTKTKNPVGFRLGQMYYICAGSNYTSGNYVGTSGVRSYQSLMDLRYSTNCQTNLTARKPLYIKGTYNPATGLFYLADTWWTQTEPTTEDGFIYLYIGWVYDTYRVDFSGYHPPIWYKDGTIRPFVVNEANSTVAGLMSAEDKEKLDTFTVGTATMPGKTNQSTGWFRIAKIGGLDGAYANFTMFVTGCWANGAPTTGEFKLHVRSNGARITQTGALLGTIITQIRLVYDSSDNKFFVDVYQGNTYTSTSSMGTQLFKFFGHGSLETYNPTEPLTGDDITAEAAASLTIKDNGMVAPKFYGALEGNANTATTATNLDTSIASSAGDRPIWMSWINSNNKRATYDNDFTYDSSTNTLKVKKIASPELTGTPTAPTAADGNNTTQIATTAFVQNAVGNTEIGGRNLITGRTDQWVSVTSTASEYYKEYHSDFELQVGETYTFSIILDKVSDDDVSLYITWGNGSNTTYLHDLASWKTGYVKPHETKYSITYTVQEGDLAKGTFFHWRIRTEKKVTTYRYKCVKLERGNKATDWTPAPEDLVSSISLSGSTLSYNNAVGIQAGTMTLTKSTVGLGNVDNTSDANKPISTATQTALDQMSAKIGNAKLFTGTCSSAADATAKAVTCPAFTTSDLIKGTQISVYFDNTNTGAVGSLTLNVNSTGAKSIKYIYNGSYNNIPGAGYIKAGQIYNFTYDGTYWVIDMMYNTDSIPNHLRYYNNTYAKKALNANRWIVGDKDGYEEIASGVTFDLSYPILYTSGAVSQGGNNYANMYSRLYDLNLGNLKSGFTSSAKKMIYLIVTISGNTATVDSNIITDTLPSTDDGKAYITLGRLGAQSTGANYFIFQAVHPIFVFRKGALRLYSGSADVVNGHTVEADVPSGAKFTDSNVLQRLYAGNYDLPLLMSYSANNYTTQDYTGLVFRNNSIFANPSTGLITAPYLKSNNYAQVGYKTYSVAEISNGNRVDEIILYTGCKFVSGGLMPEIRITGYAYGLYEPIDLHIVFYIYDNKIYNQGVVDNGGSWHPDVYLFKYTENSVDYVAIGLKTSALYYPSLHADLYNGKSLYNNIDLSKFRFGFVVQNGDSVIPEPDNGVTCIEVPYRVNYNPKPTLTIQGAGTSIGTYDGTATATINITKSSIGLGNVENKSSATIRGELTASNVTTALGFTPLNKAGDTMTGTLTLLGGQYSDNYSSYALNLNNSNIVGVNSIYTDDLSDNAQEGIHFYRSTTAVDTLYAKNGVLYFVPNRTLGQNGTAYTILNQNNYTSYTQKVNDGNTSYLFNKGTYVGGSGAKKYLRITLPDNQAHVWNMFYMEVSLRQHSPSESGGKILIEAMHNATSPYTWTGFNASVLGYLPSTLTVHASDAKYFYILNDTTYASASLDRVLVGDTARSYDISAITLDWVDELPETHQDATMYYGIHTGNISAHLNDIYVNRSGDTMTGGLVINPPTGSYNEGVRINQAPSGWSALVLGGPENSTTGAQDTVWGLYTHNKNMYLSHAGSSNGSPRLVGTADGWELQGNRTYINGRLNVLDIRTPLGQSPIILCEPNIVNTSTTLVDDNTTNLTTSTSDAEWIKALLKQICINYPGRNGIFRGYISPNSVGYYEIYIYNTSDINETNGLPKHSYGTWRHYASTFGILGTTSFSPYYYELLNSSNYSSWVVPKTGGTFSGAVTINGNLTIESGKDIILPNNYGIRGTLSDGSTSNTWMLYMGSDNKVHLSYGSREVVSAGKITSSNGFEGDLIGHASEDLPLTGGQLTGDLTLHSDSGNSPALIFHRGADTDSYSDWKIVDISGNLYFYSRTGTAGWTQKLLVAERSGTVTATTFSGALTGNATSATALKTSGTILTDLGSTTATTYTSGGNITPGIKGTLPVSHGGTGATTFDAYRALIGNGDNAITASNWATIRQITLNSASTTEEGWERICKITSTTDSGYCQFLLHLNGVLANAQPTTATFLVTMMHTTFACIKQISGHKGTGGHFNKLRLVNVSGGTYWLDMFHPAQSKAPGLEYLQFFGNVELSDIATSRTLFTDAVTVAATCEVRTMPDVPNFKIASSDGTNESTAVDFNGTNTVLKLPSTIKANLTGNVTGNVTGNLTGTVTGHASLDLPLAGGTMTGPLKWKDSTALPQATSASYLLTIDAFASGGTTKWITTDNVKVGSATKDGNGNVIATSYVNYGGNDQGLGSGTTAEKVKEYFANAEKVPAGMIKFFYNNSGAEFTTIFSKAPGSNYGSALKWGYQDQYLRILRYQANAWKTEDWEKIYAGYADSAGYTTNLRSSIVDINNGGNVDDLLTGSNLTFTKVSHLNIGWDSNDGLILNIPWSTAYGRQIALDDNTSWMATRAKNNTSGWTEWDRILTKSYGDTLYLSKTGTHAHTVMDLSFGTKGLAGGLDPITAYNIGPSASNKTFGLPAEAITVEYSTDAGATWQDYGLSDYGKKALFAETREQWIYAGKNSTSGQGSTNYWLRVTIYPSDGRYAYVNGLYLWVKRAGVTATVDLQRSTRGNPDTFTEVFSGQDIAGWPENNIRYFSSNSFGGDTDQTSNGYKYRMIFKITSITDANYGTLSVSDIRFLGSSVFSFPSGNYMMKHNRLYNWDADLNAVFPANITATKFIAPIIQTGTDSTSYFQSQKFRGQGDANSYYHAIDFGYGGHNQVDFYEYGGLYNFWKNTGSGTSTAVLLGKITTNGWEGNVVGNVTGTASNLTNFKVTTTTNLGIDAPGTNAIGYVSGLTSSAWNYNRTDGALYTQFYSANWQHQIYGDYRTGHISVRGKNNGTWQDWKRVLDEGNYKDILNSVYLGISDNAVSASALVSASSVTSSSIDDFISVNQLTWAHASSISGIGLSGNDGMVIAMPYSVNSTSYGRQFLIDDDSTKIFTRYRSSNSWKDWDQVLTRSVFDTLGYLPMYSTAIIGEDLDFFMTKNGFQWAKLTNATGLGLSNNDGMVFYVPFGNSFNSGRQFILDDDSNKMFTRYKASGSSWTSSWDQILTKSVADGIYASGDFVSKSGDTITGGYLHISNGLTNGTTYDDGHINFNGTGTNAALIQFRDDVLYLGASRIRITDYSNMALEDPTTVSLTGDLTATGHITGSFGYAMLTIQNKAISATSNSAITGFTSSHYNDTLFSHSGNTITVKKHGVYRMVIRWHLSSTTSAASVKNVAWAKSGTTTELGWGAVGRANTYETITSEFLQEISANTTLTLIGRSEGGSSTFRGIDAWVELLELL